MVHLISGEDTQASRGFLSQLVSKYSNFDPIRLDSKEITPENLTRFLQNISLLGTPKLLILTNPYAYNNKTVEKLKDLINQNEAIIWQDKPFTATQIKLFPQAKTYNFPLPNFLFGCLNAIKPHNVDQFNQLYSKIIKDDKFDLFLYLFKNKLRKEITTYSKFPENTIVATYQQTIELETLYKNGQLPLPREIALERLIINLIR